jgi:hypothetical protein
MRESDSLCEDNLRLALVADWWMIYEQTDSSESAWRSMLMALTRPAVHRP